MYIRVGIIIPFEHTTLSFLQETVYNGTMAKTEKKSRFSFKELKTAATSLNAEIRKKVFEEYFEQFEEFPSYLFDNTNGIDSRLSQTIQSLKDNPETSEKMRKGIALLLNRLSIGPETA